MEKIIFLDIDGVLNSAQSLIHFKAFGYPTKIKQAYLKTGEIDCPYFDPISVSLLKAIVKTLGAKIVISSTWRLNCSMQDFNLIFNYYGFNTEDVIIGKTHNRGDSRSTQIKDWVSDNNILDFIIIDDIHESNWDEDLREKLINVNGDVGFNMINVKQILKICNKTDEELFANL